MILRRSLAIFAQLGVGVVAFGCATSAPEMTSPSSQANSPSPHYQLDAKEQKLNCKELTGRMRVRILQIRDANTSRNGTVIARGMQTTATSIFGGGKEGSDPSGQYARDRAQLDAYNAALAAQKCKTFDLNAELQPKNYTETPTPR